jgi:hypothetical protein
MIGKFETSFVVDRDRGAEVWNQPVVGYDFTYGPSWPTNSSANTSIIPVSTRLYFTVETVPIWIRRTPLVRQLEYHYELEVDANGTIVGGSYLTVDDSRVDFAWFSQISDFFGYFSKLKDIYVNSTGDTRDRFGIVPNLMSFIKEENTFTDVTHSFTLTDYRPREYREWSISPNPKLTQEIDGILIHFSRFDTESYRDTVRIYENADGTGALVAVLHGSYPEGVSIKVKAPGALVVFKSDSQVERSGFTATYSILNAQPT